MSMKTVILILALSAMAFGCDPTKRTCSFPTNVAWDTAGSIPYPAAGAQVIHDRITKILRAPVRQAAATGLGDYVDVVFPMIVPADYTAQIVRVYGTFQGWPVGAIPAGTNAGILWGILTADPGPSPFVADGLASSNCPDYGQTQVGSDGSTITFDHQIADGVLSNGQFIVRLGIFLNDTGMTIHSELTLNVDFRFIKEDQ